MSTWPAARASRVLAALLRIGWTLKRTTGSHRVLARPEWPDFVFEGKLIHDFRRTAFCSMVRAGIPDAVAKRLNEAFRSRTDTVSDTTPTLEPEQVQLTH